jgi:hypothetical protein
MNADHLGDLPAPIHAVRARSARCLALVEADDELLHNSTTGIDHAVDRLATDVGISEAGYVHARSSRLMVEDQAGDFAQAEPLA